MLDKSYWEQQWMTERIEEIQDLLSRALRLDQFLDSARNAYHAIKAEPLERKGWVFGSHFVNHFEQDVEWLFYQAFELLFGQALSFHEHLDQPVLDWAESRLRGIIEQCEIIAPVDTYNPSVPNARADVEEALRTGRTLAMETGDGYHPDKNVIAWLMIATAGRDDMPLDESWAPAWLWNAIQEWVLLERTAPLIAPEGHLDPVQTFQVAYLAHRDIAEFLESGITMGRARNEYRLKALTAQRATGFHHSDDYSTVNWNDQTFRFAPAKAAIIQVLHKSHLRGKPDMRNNDIIEQADDIQRIGSKHIQRLFKHDPAWGSLIVRSARGFYRLNI